MKINPKSLKQVTSFPKEPEFLVSIKGREQLYRTTKDATKEELGVTSLETSVAANTNDITNLQSPGYKEYAALFSQVGTANPTVRVFANTFGGDFVWTRVGAGDYKGVLIGAFNNEPVISVHNAILDSRTEVYYASADQINIETQDFAGTPSDSLMNSMSVSFKVYDAQII